MERISLNGAWRARLDPENIGLAAGWAQSAIQADCLAPVPGCIQRVAELAQAYPPQNGLRNGYKGTWFLETNLLLPELQGRNVYLHIGGAAPACHLFLNGQYVGRHIYTLCPWEENVTRFVCAGENRLTIAVTEDYSLMYAGSRFRGLDWSGIYGEVYAWLGGAVRLQDVYLSERGIEGCAANDGAEGFSGTLRAEVCGQRVERFMQIAAGARETFLLPVDTDPLPRWTPEHPRLVELCLRINGEETRVTTGFRTLKAQNGRIYLNDAPLFLAGAGEEYESLDISPLMDENVIRRRFSALKAHGFCFYRYHTHAPSEAELRMADEMGLLVGAEFGLVSNFHKTLPVEKCLEMLPRYVRATRWHPSLFCYCLGNEGSQLMVESAAEREKARVGYELIRQNTRNQFALACFGMQGELPEVPNDIETPHLWSDNFLFAYDGLSRVPWDLLGGTSLGRPCVLHEYGKFGVWPSMRDQEALNAHKGILQDFASQARMALREHGLLEQEERFIDNSRRQCGAITRLILEEARRQACLSGFVLWSFFRGGSRNTGLCDDTGAHYDGDPAVFRQGCNAPVALLMDRGFQGRALPCYIPQRVGISLSNFSARDVRGMLQVSLLCEGQTVAEAHAEVSANSGETKEVLAFHFSVPGEYQGKKLVLRAEMDEAQNAWDFWAFDSAVSDAAVLLYVRDPEIETLLLAQFPKAVRLQDADSLRLGCRAWNHPQWVETALALRRPVIADGMDAITQAILHGGGRVLFLDTGRLPAEWYTPALLPQLGERDTGRFYTSFRAGWHTGNLLTVVEQSPTLAGFPQEGFCDLQFYAMVQSARGLNHQRVEADLQTDLRSLVYAVANVPYQQPQKPLVQDPNAIREQETVQNRTFDLMCQNYLLAGEAAYVCSMKLLRDPAGKALLKLLVSRC